MHSSTTLKVVASCKHLMKSHPFLLYIIDKLSTDANVTRGVDQRKNFKVTQKMIDMYGKNEIISLLKELELIPSLGVNVKWRYNGMILDDVERFSIHKSKLPDLCELANVVNKADRFRDAQSFFQKKLVESDGLWINDYYKACISGAKNDSVQKVLKDPDFHTGLFALALNKDVLYYRTFSQRIFHNSKKFESSYKNVFSGIIKKYHPLAVDGMGDQELLELCNLYSYSQTFEYLGDMDIVLDNCIIHGSGVYPGMILNTKALRSACDVFFSDKIKHIVTIENKDNYYSMCYREDVLFIFVHGFLSPVERKLCACIRDRASEKNISIHHWGDLDFGGIRIYEFMKKVFPKIKPYHMSSSDYISELSGSPGIDIRPETKNKLINFETDDLSDLKDAILHYGKVFEQEEQL